MGQRRGRATLGMLAATLAVAGCQFLSPADEAPTRDPDPGTTAPQTPATSAPEQTSPTPASPAPGQTMMWQGRATFDNFTVELLEDTGEGEMIEGKAGLPIEVCVTKALEAGQPSRVSLEPWHLEDSNGNVQRPQVPGAYEPAFPAEGSYGEGECVSGYLTFDLITEPVDYVELVYANGLGDRAVWQFH
ncbi:hypothetical protein GCM10028820_23600 [Tessaracoccus terricola]